MPNKLLGQNFLQSDAVIKKIVDAIDPRRGETIVEIGPGLGALTWPLLELCAAAHADLIAIEKDMQLSEKLSLRAREFPDKELEIITGDILEILDRNFMSHHPSLKVVGNIPYYLTGHLLRIISELAVQPSRCVFMVQKEVAERMTAQTGEMNRLSASVQFWAQAKILTPVSKKDFSPIPKVDSAVIVLDKKAQSSLIEPDRYFSAMRVLFSQPRKTILNNLMSVREKNDKDSVLNEVESLEIKPTIRPQDLSIENIVKIAEAFF